MNDLDTIVFEQDGKPMADSRDVAEKFGKRHDNVMQAIANIIKLDPISALSFKERDCTDSRGKRQPCYLMNEAGFSLLVMGFNNSAKALEWKRKYIMAFQAMRDKLEELAALEAGEHVNRLEANQDKIMIMVEAMAAAFARSQTSRPDQQQDSDYLTLPQLIRLINVPHVPKAMHGAIAIRWVAFMLRHERFPSRKNGIVQFERELTTDFITEALRDSIKEATAKHRRKYSKQSDIIDLFDHMTDKDETS